MSQMSIVVIQNNVTIPGRLTIDKNQLPNSMFLKNKVLTFDLCVRYAYMIWTKIRVI